MARIILGIDPGKEGAIVAMRILDPNSGQYKDRGLVTIDLFPLEGKTDKEICNYLITQDENADPTIFAVIEEQIPRPTTYYDDLGHYHSSILKSTCILYGGYKSIEGMLLALHIPFRNILPQVWQKHYSMKRRKGEQSHKWKGRLKSVAQSLFPSEKITLATADAILIAEYGRSLNNGTI